MHVYRFMEHPAPWRTKDRIETLILEEEIKKADDSEKKAESENASLVEADP